MAKPALKPLERTFRVFLDPARNRFVAVDDSGDLLGVSMEQDNAIGSAVREANLASRAGQRVVVIVEGTDGKYRKEHVADPPRH